MMIDNKKIKVSLYNTNTQKIVFKDVTGVPDKDIWANQGKGEYSLIAELK
jgi:hypothetical protein